MSSDDESAEIVQRLDRIRLAPGYLDHAKAELRSIRNAIADYALAAAGSSVPEQPRARRYDQCDETCTADCGHCKGAGVPEQPATETCEHGKTEPHDVWSDTSHRGYVAHRCPGPGLPVQPKEPNE